MDQAGVLVQFKDLGVAAALGLAATGSALGIGVAGMAAVGAWKKCYAQNRMAPFLLIVFIGAPLSQTIYGMILMNKIAEVVAKGFFFHRSGFSAGRRSGRRLIIRERSGPAERTPWPKRAKALPTI